MASRKEHETNLLLQDIYERNNDHFKKTATPAVSDPVAREKNERAMTAGIIFLAVAGLIGGFLSIRGNLSRPFSLAARDPQTNAAQTVSNQVSDLSGEAGAQPLDTDLDGLSDQDEIGTYYTSPYLEDSDSDGVGDAEEIEKGTDPNCLPNAPCARPNAKSSPTTAAVTTNEGSALFEATPEKLREFLGQSGVDPAIIDSLSDDELMGLYQSVAVPSAPQGQTAATASSDITAMSPDQLREFLKANGMTEDMLNRFTDQEMLEIVTEIVEEETK